MKCGMCGGDVGTFDAGNSDLGDGLERWECKGCGASAVVTLDEYGGDVIQPAWIAAPLSTMIVRCLRVYGRDGRRVRTPGSKTCVAWERK